MVGDLRYPAVLFAAIGLASPALAGRAWLASTEDEKAWCGFTTEARVAAAVKGDRFENGQSVELSFHGNVIDELTEELGSEDAMTDDQYSFSGDRVTQVTRRGHYITDPMLQVTLVPDRNGKFVLTTASRLERARRDKAGQSTYWVDWPLYPALSKFPFATLIRTRPKIGVLDACQSLHWTKHGFTVVGKPH